MTFKPAHASRQYEFFRFSHCVFPSQGEGGDFACHTEREGGEVVFFFCDVAGKGEAAAAVAGQLKGFFAAAVDGAWRADGSPAELLRRLNRDLCGAGGQKSAAAILGALNPLSQQLTYSVAGHWPMPLFKGMGRFSFLSGAGQPIGLFPEIEVEDYTRNMGGRFTLILCSDGICGQLSPSVKESEKLLKQRLNGATDAADAAARLNIDTSRPAEDDMSILVVSR